MERFKQKTSGVSDTPDEEPAPEKEKETASAETSEENPFA